MQSPRRYLFVERVFTFGVLIFLLLSLASPSLAQWRKAKTFEPRLGSSITSLYFLDGQGSPDIGFLGVFNSKTSKSQIWRSSDGGSTWTLSIDVPYQFVCQFAFKNELRGWVATSDHYTTGSVYSTSDGGKSWEEVPTISGAANGIYYNAATNLLIVSRWGVSVGSMISSDEGQTWKEFADDRNGVAFLNDKVGLASTVQLSALPYLITTDGGLSWNVRAQMVAECWQPLAIPETHTFLALSEVDHRVYASTDEGMSWEQRSILAHGGLQSSGQLLYNGCLVYTQTSSGISASTDEGYTWHYLGGPSIGPDTRMHISGNRIWAADYSTLWINDNGGYWDARLEARIDTLDTHYEIALKIPTDYPLINPDSVTFTVDLEGAGLEITEVLAQPEWTVDKDEILSPTQRRFAVQCNVYPEKVTLGATILKLRVRPIVTERSTSARFTIRDVKIDTLTSLLPCMGIDSQSTTYLNLSVEGCEAKYISHVLRGEKAIAIKSINPNPTNGSITIDYESKLSGAVTISVYSVNGVLVHEEVLAADPSHKPIQLDASGWASGAYTLVLKSGKEEARGSVIKN